MRKNFKFESEKQLAELNSVLVAVLVAISSGNKWT